MSKRGHVPVRMCIGCRRRKAKKELLRLTQSEDGSFFPDRSGSREGRGFYLCPDVSCLKKAQKKKRINRVAEIPESGRTAGC